MRRNARDRDTKPPTNAAQTEGGTSVKSLLDAIRFVQRTSGTARSTWGEPPRGFIPRSWISLVFPGSLDADFKRHHYVVRVAHQLHAALKRGDVFVRGSNHHGDPQAQMLSGDTWAALKAEVTASLGLTLKPEAMLKRWSRTLDETYKTVAKALPNNPLLRVSSEGGAPELIITPFDALPEIPRFWWTRATSNRVVDLELGWTLKAQARV